MSKGYDKNSARQVSISLPAEVFEAIENLRGYYSRSNFILRSIEETLEKEKKRIATEAVTSKQ